MKDIVIPGTQDFPELIKLWEQSVRASHHFLAEEDLQMYKDLLSSVLSGLELYSLRESTGITAFIAISEDMVQALFIHPDHRGKGIGSRLMKFAIDEKGVRKVDVNEQNESALRFYKKLGFIVTGRTPVDGMKKSYPILSMELISKTIEQ